jgi:hypothetical protein
MKELEPHPTGEDWRWDQTDFFDFLDLPFFRGFGFAFMSTSIACSRDLHGQAELDDLRFVFHLSTVHCGVLSILQ